MSTQNASARRAGPRTWAVIAALLSAGTLAAGCGTPPAGSPAAGAAPTAPTGSATTASAGSAPPASTGSATFASASPASPASSQRPSGAAAPVPTVSGGTVAAGVPACAGWPEHAPAGSLPASFVPVTVERCVNGAQTIPGKGLWQTASLERADSGLDALVSALRQPPGKRQPGTACPMLAIIPPQLLLISATGQELVPRIPLSACGLIQPQVLAALAALPWRLVSVRLIANIPGASGSGAAP